MSESGGRALPEFLGPQTELAELHVHLGSSVDPAVMWAGALLRQAHFQWGVAVVAAGSLMILAAAAIKD